MFYKVPLLEGDLFVNENITIQFNSFGAPKAYFLNTSPTGFQEDYVKDWLTFIGLKIPRSFGDHKAHIFNLSEHFVKR